MLKIFVINRGLVSTRIINIKILVVKASFLPFFPDIYLHKVFLYNRYITLSILYS